MSERKNDRREPNRREPKREAGDQLDLSSEDELFTRYVDYLSRSDALFDTEDRLFEQAMQSEAPSSAPERSLPARAWERDGEALDLGSEDRLFEQAMQGASEAPEHPAAASGETRQRAASHRKHQVQRGQVFVEATLDLHGYKAVDALRELQQFLGEAQAEGLRIARVVIGKGLHSRHLPVLRDEVVSWLKTDGQKHVGDFYWAPKSLGGRGALILFLRPT